MLEGKVGVTAGSHYIEKKKKERKGKKQKQKTKTKKRKVSS